MFVRVFDIGLFGFTHTLHHSQIPAEWLAVFKKKSGKGAGGAPVAPREKLTEIYPKINI